MTGESFLGGVIHTYDTGTGSVLPKAKYIGTGRVLSCRTSCGLLLQWLGLPLVSVWGEVSKSRRILERKKTKKTNKKN